MKHPEAFCVMKYKCEKCLSIEMIWNSRDGVTPFTIMCKCGGCMEHVEWKNDIKISRVFISISTKEAEEIAVKRVDSIAKNQGVTHSKEERLNLIENVAKDIYGEGRTPTSVKVKELKLLTKLT